MADTLTVSLEKLAKFVNLSIPVLAILFLFGGIFFSFYFHIGSVIFIMLTALNVHYTRFQEKHTILRNFGVLGQLRYMFESVGPEFRQYFFMSDTEERPFTRDDRSEVYRKAKDVDSSLAFGSLKEFDEHELKIRHSFFPKNPNEVKKYSITFGEERNLKSKFTITKPFMISAMSFGSLGENAVRALSKGAKIAQIPMNTGEGGLSPYHLSGGANIIFQMGTAKFGVRNEDGSLNDSKLKEVAKHKEVKMVEIKFSQGAKPGKGGLLPKEKITKEIAKIRGIPEDKDVVSPPHHIECTSPEKTVKFIKHVQDVSELPVGIKLCLGRPDEFRTLVQEMKKQKVFPDYISVDGAEGGTGAAPKGFMDDVGMKIFDALPIVNKVLKEEKVRNKLKLVAAGKLISPGKQIKAMCLGADAVYSARGFMFALGCIQALQCNKNTCPVGITTHDKNLQKGLVVDDKAQRIANYAKNLEHDFYQLLASTGVSSSQELSPESIYIPKYNIDVEAISAKTKNRHK